MVKSKLTTFAAAKQKQICFSKQNVAPVAQLVEHLTLNQRVQGSNPCRRTKKQKGIALKTKNQNVAPVAQLVEHLTLNQRVQGSNPCRRTSKSGALDLSLRFFYLHYNIQSAWEIRQTDTIWK